MARDDLPKRFYKEAAAIERDGAFVLALDGRPARTPAKALLAMPSRALAEAVAAEWNAQAERIDPAAMPLTRIVNSAIDGVSREMAAVRGDIVAYAGSDMLCYRTKEPEELARRQSEAWDPVLAWAKAELGCAFNHIDGIVFAPQPIESLEAVDQAVRVYDPIGLSALHVITTLTGSAILALAVARGRLEAELAWEAAHVDENHQIERWGADEEAKERRASRWRDMEAAARILALSRDQA